MNIWLVTIGEPIPHQNNKLRLHRTGIIAKYISENTNFKVTWWTSDFNHFAKEHIFGKDTFFEPNKNLKIIALHGRGYKSNISMNRLLDHREIAQKFKNEAFKCPIPDIIVSAFPTLGLCQECIAYGKRFNIPVLIDYRDMWPEVFVDIVPNFAKIFAKFTLSYLFLKTKNVFSEAKGIIGITNEFLHLALDKIGRQKNIYDAVFPLAYLCNQYTAKQLDDAKIFWDYKLPRSNKLRISFLGTLGYQYDLDTILHAVQILNIRGQSNFEIILCGSGDKENFLITASKKVIGLHLPGYMSAAQIKVLLSTSDIGICPYNLSQAFLNSIPGKAIEYMSFGVPILSTLKNGELGRLIDKHKIGFHYEHGNPESLADVIENLIKIRVTLPEMKDKILSVFKSNFDADLIYASYVKHLENILTK